jgi:hypothetical protein
MPLRILACICFICVTRLAQDAGQVEKERQAKAAADLRARIEASPKLPFNGVRIANQSPASGWEAGFVSWVAIDSKGLIYELQRGDKADPVLVVDREGKVLRSWGKGNYKIPHSIRIDPSGNGRRTAGHRRRLQRSH